MIIKKKQKNKFDIYEKDKITKIKIKIDYQIKSFKNLFEYCECIIYINFIKFYRNNIVNMNCMFFNCTSLIDLNLSIINTNNVTDMMVCFMNVLL